MSTDDDALVEGTPAWTNSWASIFGRALNGAFGEDLEEIRIQTGEEVKTGYGSQTSYEWEVSELEVKKPISDTIGSFLELATSRWQKGVDEYREGDETIPFAGDPLVEATEEAADLYAYSMEANRQGLLTDDECDQLNVYALDAFNLIKRAIDGHSKAAAGDAPDTKEST